MNNNERQRIEADFKAKEEKLAAEHNHQRQNYDTDSEWIIGLEKKLGSLEEQKNNALSDLEERIKSGNKKSPNKLGHLYKLMKSFVISVLIIVVAALITYHVFGIGKNLEPPADKTTQEVYVEEQNTATSYGQQGGLTAGKVEVNQYTNTAEYTLHQVIRDFVTTDNFPQEITFTFGYTLKSDRSMTHIIDRGILEVYSYTPDQDEILISSEEIEEHNEFVGQSRSNRMIGELTLKVIKKDIKAIRTKFILEMSNGQRVESNLSSVYTLTQE